MPKIADGRFPKYSRHKASGQAVVTIAGVDHYLGAYGTKSSRQEYDRLIAEWLAAGRPARLPRLNDITVAELAKAYLDFAQGYYRKPDGRQTKTVDVIKAAIRKLIGLYAHTLAVEFGPACLKAVQQAMIRGNSSRSYINDVSSVIRRIFRWGVTEELLPVTVYQALAIVPGLARGRSDARETRPRGPVDDAAVASTLSHLPTVVAAMVQIQRLTGMRPSEVCMLRPGDIDRNCPIWVYSPVEHKTEHHGTARSIAIGPKAQALLEPYLTRPADMFCFSPAESENARRAERHIARQTPIELGNHPGSNRVKCPKRTPTNRYNKDSYARAVTRACDRANVSRWSPNQLRHAFGTECRRRFGLEAAQASLGHANADVTQLYAAADVQKASEVARQIG